MKAHPWKAIGPGQGVLIVGLMHMPQESDPQAIQPATPFLGNTQKICDLYSNTHSERSPCLLVPRIERSLSRSFEV
jgi:hypothetical protein